MSQSARLPAGRQPGQGRPAYQFSGVSPEELRQIIVEGDPVRLVEVAERVGRELAQPEGRRTHPDALATSQIRSIFGKVRELDMQLRAAVAAEHDQLDDGIYRELHLLRPKLAYQAERAPGQGVRHLQQVLEPAIKLVERSRARFQRFVDFFEAILAYHKAYGGQ
jgi:CRISPR-associated protein Csm2